MYMAFIEPMHRNKPNITYLLTHIKHKHLNITQPIIKVVFMGMVVSAFLLKINSFIAKFNFKLICRL